MQIRQANNQNFGWSGKTHYHITSTISQRIPELSPYRKLLGFSAVIPDWSMSKCWAGLKKPHLYYGEEFLSFDTVPQNASDFYFILLSKALQNLRCGNKKIGMYYAGNALHFLQDATCPLHTQKECLKLSKSLTHKKYEQLAKTENLFISNIISSADKVNDTNFQDCFTYAYKHSSEMKNPFEIDKKEWPNSVRKSLTNACDSTFQFLTRLSGLMDIPLDKQEEKFTKEVVETFKI